MHVFPCFHYVDFLCMAMCSPTGKVFSDEDLAFIARLCVKHNTYAVCDEARIPLFFGTLCLELGFVSCLKAGLCTIL